jgi:hypothetical protein
MQAPFSLIVDAPANQVPVHLNRLFREFDQFSRELMMHVNLQMLRLNTAMQTLCLPTDFNGEVVYQNFILP